ncbi:hypothetical protein OZX57_06415 [Bifidobacterium sp. ESL0682]|uniref:hypothetical protein n=1 Tax=Bifidobacterium sp. ESL0682 TaxID=2983212 RepID=UPI0023F751AC|nr:hypothetical protein [Bifidobacterium sp. ESL0682]WEV41619.1 hypothetical protein OZX57_06415 [Bifidobacterium sp. ESL0682]
MKQLDKEKIVEIANSAIDSYDFSSVDELAIIRTEDLRNLCLNIADNILKAESEAAK